MQRPRLGSVALALGVTIALATTAGSLFAGRKAEQLVLIERREDGSARVFADLGAVRNSGDAVQFAGCSVSTSPGSVVWCSATDAAARKFSCIATTQRFLDVAASIDGASSLFINANNLGQCTTLEVSHSSLYRPMTP
jgi:hypothetical protein